MSLNSFFFRWLYVFLYVFLCVAFVFVFWRVRLLRVVNKEKSIAAQSGCHVSISGRRKLTVLSGDTHFV